MFKNRFLLLPIGALVVVLLSYALVAIGGVSGRPNVPTRAEASDPVTQPQPLAAGTAIGAVDTTETDSKIAFWQGRIKANPSSDSQYQYLGELFALKGRQTGDIAQYALAAQAFQKAVDLFPGNVAARSDLAINLVTLHQWTQAIAEGKQILQADLRAMGAVAVIGDASLEIGDLDTAQAAYETLRQKADGPSVQSRIARLAFLNGQTASAIKTLDDAAATAASVNASAEEQAFYHYSAGEYRWNTGDIAGAESEYEAALALFPNYYLALSGRGRVAFAKGDLDTAIGYYRSAVAIIPKPELLAYLGDLYALKGDAAGAEKQYQAVDFIVKLNELEAQVFNREIALFQATHRRDTAHAVEITAGELQTRKDIYGYDAVGVGPLQQRPGCRGARAREAGRVARDPGSQAPVPPGNDRARNRPRRRRASPPRGGAEAEPGVRSAGGGGRAEGAGTVMGSRAGRRILVLAATGALALLLPLAVAAHPLGNFTINHYAGLRIAADRISLDVVIDQAEIPTFQERQRIDTSGDGQLSDDELSAERVAACPRLAESLLLTAGGTRLPLVTTAAGLSFPPGAGGLPTMRTVCEYEASLATAITTETSIQFQDRSSAGRLGWREIVVAGDGTTPATDLPSSSVSGRLTAYPQDLLSLPLDVQSADVLVRPGGAALGPWNAPDATSLSATGSPAAAATDPASTGSVPGGVGNEISGLLGTSDLTPIVVVLSFAAAAVLGAGHALTPGHGKTIMAAYLVGTRGSSRQAIGLGLATAVSHTIGVLVLALVIVVAGAALPADRVYPILSLVSALIVVAVGAWLLAGQVGRRLRTRPATSLRCRHAHGDRDVVRARRDRDAGGPRPRPWPGPRPRAAAQSRRQPRPRVGAQSRRHARARPRP